MEIMPIKYKDLIQQLIDTNAYTKHCLNIKEKIMYVKHSLHLYSFAANNLLMIIIKRSYTLKV